MCPAAVWALCCYIAGPSILAVLHVAGIAPFLLLLLVGWSCSMAAWVQIVESRGRLGGLWIAVTGSLLFPAFVAFVVWGFATI